MNSADLAGSLERWLDKRGVETMIVVLRNPDTSEVVLMARGDPIWIAGALVAGQSEIMREARKAVEGRNDG